MPASSVSRSRSRKAMDNFGIAYRSLIAKIAGLALRSERKPHANSILYRPPDSWINTLEYHGIEPGRLWSESRLQPGNRFRYLPTSPQFHGPNPGWIQTLLQSRRAMRRYDFAAL
jgi:hypothetical protein